MPTQLLSKVEIDGVDIATALKGWKVDEAFGEEVNSCVIEVSRSIFNLVPDLQQAGKTISITRGKVTSTDQNVFHGFVDEVVKDGERLKIKGKDNMIILVEKLVNYSYDGFANPSTEAKGSYIAQDMIETWGGMTAEVVDTGSTLTLRRFVCRGMSVFSYLKQLADIYDYQIRYDPDDSKVHFEPKGYTEVGTVLYVSGSNRNIVNLPKWGYDDSQVVNKLTVKGAMQEVEDEEYFSGDASANQVFSLAKKPISVQVWEEVGGSWILKTPGVEDSTPEPYDYEIDAEDKEIQCTDDWTPASGSNNVWVKYTNAIPQNVIVDSTDSISQYGREIEEEKNFNDIESVADAEVRGNAWLEKYAYGFVNTKIVTASLIDFEAGHKIRVVDAINDEDRQMVINKIEKKFPSNGDVLHLGDKEWRLAEWGTLTLERIKRLEEKNQRDSDLIVTIKRFSNDLDIGDSVHYINIGVDGTGFILDSATRGVLGTSTLGDVTAFGTLTRRVWKDRTYSDSFDSDDWKDSVNTTATWTGNNSITF